MNTPPRRATRAVVVFALLLTLSILLLGSITYGQSSDTLTVDYIDVGQGDSVYLHASDGTDILIDGGPARYAATTRRVPGFQLPFPPRKSLKYCPQQANHFDLGRPLRSANTLARFIPTRAGRRQSSQPPVNALSQFTTCAHRS